MTAPDNILIYSSTGALLSHHQRSFPLQQMGTNRDPQLDNVRRVRDPRTHHPKGMSLLNSSSQESRTPQKRSQKDFNSLGIENTKQTNKQTNPNAFQTTGLLSKPDEVPGLRHNAPCLSQKLSPNDNHLQRKRN